MNTPPSEIVAKQSAGFITKKLKAAWSFLGIHNDSLQVLFAAIALILAVIGARYGYVELKENTRSNLMNCRAQIYDNERAIYDREVAETKRGIGSIYFQPPASIVDVKEYAKLRLRPIAPDSIDALMAAKNADDLGQIIAGLDSFPTSSKDRSYRISPRELDNLRKIYVHMDQILYHLHLAFDYVDELVMEENEWKTWRGMIDAIGPHPLLLICISDGLNSKYMSQSFARELRTALVEADTRNIDVIRYYLPEFLEGNFEQLPDYPAKKLRKNKP